MTNILPDSAGGRGGGGSYASTFGPAAIQRLKAWVGDGGTVVGIGGAVSFLADAAVGLLAVQQEDKAGALPIAPPSGGGRGGATTPTPAAVGRIPGKIIASEADFEKAIQPDSELPESMHGAIVKCRVDSEQWISAGVREEYLKQLAFKPLLSRRAADAA